MIYLDTLLDQTVDTKEYNEQVKWLLSIFKWIRMPKDLQNHNIPKDRIYSVRIKYLLILLEKNPQWRTNFISSISSVLNQMSSVRIFSDVGMSLNTSFIQEFIRRIEEKILPQAPLADNLSSLLLELFPDEDESLLINKIDESVFNEFILLFANDDRLIQHLIENILISVQALSIQLLANTYTLHREIYENISAHQNWPESKLALALDPDRLSEFNVLHLYLLEAKARLEIAYLKMEEKGIKIDLVYLIESQRRKIERIQALLQILNRKESSPISIRNFIAKLVLDIHHQYSLRSFFKENLSLLTKQIVRNNSDLGEHYVTFDWSDFSKMYRCAVGGGALTSVTVYIKLLTSSLALSGFIKGLAESLNYTFSFLAIQSMGWTLATKQPSTTAPYLADSLKKSSSDAKTSILAILRTQFISVLGNLTLVMPICFFISWGLKGSGHPILTEESSYFIFSSSNFLSFSFVFAAFTGVLLFISSLIAGWFDNWITLHKVPERLQNHQNLIRFLGLKKTKKLADLVSKSANPIAANISLGFLLGFVPQYLKFMGIPLEVRHITLSAGNLAASLPLLNFELIKWYEILNSISGLLMIGVLNIAVSFTLALILASASSQIPFNRLLKILFWGMRLVLTKPWFLVLPPKAPI